MWYPAVAATTAGHKQESIDLASMLSPALKAKVPLADRVLYLADAYQDAPPATTPGNYPLVVFSHGFAGYPEQSVSLTTHLASWGFVVAAPNHVERSLDGLLGTATKGVPKSTDLAVLQATLGLVEKDSLESSGRVARDGRSEPRRRGRALRRRVRGVPVRVGRRSGQGVDLVLGRPRRAGRARAAAPADEAGHGDARHDRRRHSRAAASVKVYAGMHDAEVPRADRARRAPRLLRHLPDRARARAASSAS